MHLRLAAHSGEKIQVIDLIGAPGRTRTCGHPLRRRMLYPAELRAQNSLIPPTGGVASTGRPVGLLMLPVAFGAGSGHSPAGSWRSHGPTRCVGSLRAHPAELRAQNSLIPPTGGVASTGKTEFLPTPGAAKYRDSDPGHSTRQAAQRMRGRPLPAGRALIRSLTRRRHRLQILSSYLALAHTICIGNCVLIDVCAYFSYGRAVCGITTTALWLNPRGL